MKERQQFDVWREDLKPLLESKSEEFRLLGYENVTEEDIWDCTVSQFQNEKEFVRLHRFVNALLSLKPQTYMMWLTVKAYKNPDALFSSDDEEN